VGKPKPKYISAALRAVFYSPPTHPSKLGSWSGHKKCPAFGWALIYLGFAEREGFEPNLQYGLFSMYCARVVGGAPNFPPYILMTIVIKINNIWQNRILNKPNYENNWAF